MANNVESFLLYRTQCKSLLKLPDDKRGELLTNIIRYAFEGIRPEIDDLTCEVLFDQISDQIDRDQEKYQQKCERNKQIALAREAARKNKITNVYERTQEETNVHERTQTYTNDTYTDTYTGTYTDTCTDTCTDTDAKPKPTRHKYGRYKNVLLTDAELEKLKAEYPKDWQERIDRLSEYIESTGKKYKNHLATIRSWARRERRPETENERIDREQRQTYAGGAGVY